MKSKAIRLSLFAILLAGIVVAIMYRDQVDVVALENWVQNAGAAGPIVFMLLYAVGTILFFPGSVLTLAGGALFGPVMGTVYNLTGATLGATICFVIARYLASDMVAQKAGGRIKQLINGVESEGWRFVAFVRLVPLFPFNLLNYALGLTKIRLSAYVGATYLFMLPGAIAYTYVGYAGREAVAGGEGLIQKALLALALLAVVAFLPRWIAKMRRGPEMNIETLKQRIDENNKPLILDVRSQDEYLGEQGHIAGVTHIPLEQLESRIDDLTDYTESTIAIVCRTDKRSAKAAQILTRNGFADVHIVKGGMTGWNQNGYPVE
ncbi:MAG: hypothetical protein BMS9Abin15_1194 [Gammaproteobacteria bacterium]|nr:MAG: hypothetical protein BMS9Abin15_1194 [Gammaproteobacteria bacterium]